MTGPELERRAREAVRQMIQKNAWLLSKEGNRQFYRAHMEVENDDTLVDLAKDGDREALEILRKRARILHQQALTAGSGVMEVPTSLHQLLLEMFIYGPPKAKRGTGPKDTGIRYMTIALLVGIVVEDFGFPEYTHPEHRDNPDAPLSACRLVAQELGISERRVEEIWAERKASVTRRKR
jgi:hypothetical protein